ncbi:hypothetical protein PV08_08754 [Exophiala spinifera]|uniref:Xylanolytic transcriptional activator regulatory domain-containing protein n=1 Tax=Exophiala spinifera TaxID=91928 RepID=A0A0D1YET5_9EURO|nr:uncharacterized protein PV08_08754 [Exophiala spinifera]KIW13566.1 hypothetical protein PV08_08754 [Exophiala spinifera]
MFLELHGQYSLASVLCGLSIRMCQQLGLHRRSPLDLNLDPDEIKFRSQLWWIAFKFETSSPMCEGRPTAVRELTYDVDILPLCSDQTKASDTAGLVSAIHCWYARLTELSNRFATINSLCITPNTRLEALKDLNDTLTRWRDQLPVTLQPGPDVVADWNSYMLVAPFHLDYFNLLRSIHWACITAITTNWEAIHD